MKIIYSNKNMKKMVLVNLIIIILFSIGNIGVSIPYSLSLGILPLLATYLLIPSINRGSFNIVNICGLISITILSGIINIIVDPSNIGTYYLLIIIYYIEFFIFSDFTIDEIDFKYERFIPSIIKFRGVDKEDRALISKLSKFNNCDELVETIKMYGSSDQTENIYSLIMVIESEGAADLKTEIREASNVIIENIKSEGLKDENDIKVNRTILKNIKWLIDELTGIVASATSLF